MFGWNILSIWVKQAVCLGKTPLLPYPVETLLPCKKKTAQQEKGGEILCHLYLEDTFLLRAAHDDYSFSTRSAPWFYERWTRAERRKIVAGIYPWVILFIKYGLTRYISPDSFSTESFFLFRISKSYAYPPLNSYWSTTSAERVMNVCSTKRKREHLKIIEMSIIPQTMLVLHNVNIWYYFFALWYYIPCYDYTCNPREQYPLIGKINCW